MSERTLGLDVRKISNSEVATFLTCERKYYYEFDLALEPKQAAGALGRGVLLHDVLADYYTSLKEGTPPDQAARQGREYLMNQANITGRYTFETIMEVDKLLQGYWGFYGGDPDWIIREVETGYDLDLGPSYGYSLRLDLLVTERSSGKSVLVDHKTAYDFWSDDDLDLNPQFPKYIGALRASGIPVDKAVLNQIRTRVIKNPSSEQLFRRTVCVPSRAKVQNAMREQVVASEKIVKHRALPLEVRAANSLRTLNKAVCKWCNSKALCLSEYDGGDITHMIANDYKPRTYGYNDPTVLEEL